VNTERPTDTLYEEAYLVRLANAKQASSVQGGQESRLGIGCPEDMCLMVYKVGAPKGLIGSLKKPGYWWRIWTILLLIFGVWLYVTYVYPQWYPELRWLSSTHWLSLTYPKYIAVGDQGYIRVTVSNESDRPLSSKVVIDFSDADHIVCMNCTERNEIEFKDLAPHARQTWRVGFVLNEAPSFQGLGRPSVQFNVRVMDAHGDWTTDPLLRQIEVAPLPHLRTILISPPTISGGVLGGVVALLLSLPSNLIKKILGL